MNGSFAVSLASLSVLLGCGEVTSTSPDAGAGTAASCAECDPAAECTDRGDHVECACTAGYQGSGLSCQDIDECAVDQGGCNPGGQCVNLPGDHACLCPPGYTGDGRVCEQIWELTRVIPGTALYRGYGVNVLGHQGRIYMAPEGGDAPFFVSYDPLTDNLRAEALMPPERDDFCACGFGGWLVGLGDGLYYFANHGQLYDGSGWLAVNYPFEQQRGEAAAAAVGDRIYLVGGRGAVKDVAWYSGGIDGRWSLPGAVPSYPWGVEYAAAASDGTRLYVFGGTTDTGETRRAAVFDGSVWLPLPDIPSDADRPRGAGVLRGMPFVMTDSVIHVYDPIAEVWAHRIDIPFDGYYAPAVVGPDLYLVGQEGSGVAMYRFLMDL